MMLLLMRHLESDKNICGQFSSDSDAESLTREGREKAFEVAEEIKYFADRNHLTVNRVYCAASNRAKETAGFIADEFDVQISAFEDLRSNNSGALRGKNEDEALQLNPIFMKQLKLFRAGIFSSYDFEKVSEREDKRSFEKKVNGCLNRIMSGDAGNLRIVIMHHSSLTAAVIRYAREYYSYPKDYYGHVACDFGNIYLMDQDGIILCNEPAPALRKICVSGS